MCDSRSVPKYSFLFVYFYSDTKAIFRTQLFPSFSLSFTLKQKTHPIESEMKDTSYTPTIPFLSFKIIQFEAQKYLFSQWLIPFRLFHWCPNMCWKPKLYPSYSLSFTLKQKTLLLQRITSFSYIFVLFCVSYFLKYHTSSAAFLLLLLFLLLAFMDERNISMLTQNILTSSFILIQKQKTYPKPKLYPFLK